MVLVHELISELRKCPGDSFVKVFDEKGKLIDLNSWMFNYMDGENTFYIDLTMKDVKLAGCD